MRKSVIPVLVLLAGGSALLYTIAAGRGRAQQIPATRASFAATVIRKYYDGSDSLRRTETLILANRADGSSALMYLTKNDRPHVVRMVLNLPEARRVTVDPQTESLTTYKVTQAEVKMLSAPNPTCPVSAGATPATFLGYPVLVDHKQITAGSRQFDEERWVAPSLNCVALKRSDRAFESGKFIARTTEEALSLHLGDPDPSLFDLPANYTERKPSQVQAERARLEGTQCPSCEKAAGQVLDKVYESRRP